MEPKASNYTNNHEEFMSNNMDLLDDAHFRPNQFNSLRMCPVKISQLPQMGKDEKEQNILLYDLREEKHETRQI